MFQSYQCSSGEALRSFVKIEKIFTAPNGIKKLSVQIPREKESIKSKRLFRVAVRKLSGKKGRKFESLNNNS